MPLRALDEEFASLRNIFHDPCSSERDRAVADGRLAEILGIINTPPVNRRDCAIKLRLLAEGIAAGEDALASLTK
jgi:hypothetical protein